MFDNLKKSKSYTKYNLFQGVTDFGNLEQFNNLDTGLPYISIISQPKYMVKLGATNSDLANLIANAVHIMEKEFKGLDGIEDITAETYEINNGIDSINLINSVKKQSASTISMRFTEKSGSPITRYCELYLTGIKDPRTRIKTYHGLIPGVIPTADVGPHQEVFTMLYWVTDNTGFEIEKAYLILAGQITKAETSIYNGEKGNHDAKEVTVEMNCFIESNAAVYKAAKEQMQAMAIIKNSDSFVYTGTPAAKK